MGPGVTMASHLWRGAVPAGAVERFFLPNTCVACERPVGGADPDALVCGLCRSRFVPVIGGCERCQQPHPPVGPCRFCTDWPEGLEAVRSAVWLGTEATAIAHHLKYEGYARLGGTLAAVIASRVARPAGSVIVPVPLAPARLRHRGFNQAEAIGAELAAAWSLPLACGLLERVRETRTQTRLDPKTRVANVRRAFRARQAPGKRGMGQGSRVPTVILVDDVLTTGATLVAAAAALVAVGWTSIRAVTFARARPFAERIATT